MMRLVPFPPAPALPTAVATRRIGQAAEFAALRPQWNELLRSSGADCPFLTWEWMYAWWLHASSGRLNLLAITSRGTLVALAPLRITGTSGAFSTVEWLGTGAAGSDYLDVIVRSGWEQTCATALAGMFAAESRTLRFDHVAPGSSAHAVADSLAASGWTAHTAPGGSCPIIRLDGRSWDAYLASLGSAHRANVRRRLRELERRPSWQFGLVTGEAERREALAALIGFHGHRWGARGSTAFMTPALRAFHDQATGWALTAGWLRMYVLRIDDATAAVMYGFAYGGKFYFYQHGFDRQYAECSLGLTMMALSIRAAIDEGAREFDMLWGLEPYKRLWARETASLERIHVFPPNAGGACRRFASDAASGIRRAVRRVKASAGRHGR